MLSASAAPPRLDTAVRFHGLLQVGRAGGAMTGAIAADNREQACSGEHNSQRLIHTQFVCCRTP